MLKKKSGVLRDGHVEEVVDQSCNDENEDNRRGTASIDQQNSHLLAEIERLQEEDDILKCQLEALKNDAVELRVIHKETIERKDIQIAELRAIKDALDSANEALFRLDEIRSKEEEAFVKDIPSYKRRRENDNDLTDNSNDFGPGATASTSSANINPEKEARLISLISIFLHVLPFGANVDYICAYLYQMDSTIKAEYVENLLKRYPSIFKQNSIGFSARLGRNWSFVGFQK